MAHVIIIGNGISGVTTARHLRKHSDDEITIISGETDYFFSRTALMYVFMGHMQFEHTQPYENHFWKKNRINLKRCWIKDIDYKQQILFTEKGESIPYDKLVLAVGSKSNKFGWPGQDLEGAQGLYSHQDLMSVEKLAEEGITRGVIVGGGLIGIELAEMLLSRGIDVTFLVRENTFWGNVLPPGESALISDHIRKHHVDLRFGANLKEIVDHGTGKVKGVIVEETGEEIPCEFVGLTAGVSPNIDFLKGGELELGRGIKVNRFLETNIPNVYACGDCAEFSDPPKGRRSIEQVWYTGRMMGEVLAQNLIGNPTEYSPGPWFNSAKFFDIEYQTYGVVLPQLPEEQQSFYWQHPTKEIAINVVFEKESKIFIGINVFGIRMRHELFDKWLRAGASVSEVMEHLKDANFDPEFYASQEGLIVASFNQETGLNVVLKKKSWKRIFNR